MSTPGGPYAALKIADFRLFVLARFCITLAIQIQGLVVAWQVYEITHDELSLGLIGLAEAIPSIGVSLYAGHLADIMQRKKIIMSCITALLLCSVTLLYFANTPEHTLALYGVFPIYAVIFISGIARGFMTPALFSFMPQLIPRELYPNAISWNSTLWETASIAGAPIGGIIYGLVGISAAYITDVSLTIIGFALMMMVHDKPLPPVTEEEGVIQKISAGLHFVFNNKIILSAITLDLFAVLFGGAVALLPAFAEKILHVREIGLGFLRAAPSVGALLMALYMVHHPIKKNAGKILLFCVAGFGVCMIFFGLSNSFWLSLGLLMISGAFDSVSVIIRGTLLQTLTPENMKGRVSAVNNIFIGSSNEIGMFESGLAARAFGLVPSVLFGGIMTIVVVITIAVKGKSLRVLQRMD
jgi:MFS family permease